MTQKSVREITILGDTQLRNQLNLLNSNSEHSSNTGACVQQNTKSDLSFHDERAMVVNWVSNLSRQHLHFLIEKLGITDSRQNSLQNYNCEPLTDREHEVLILVASGYSRAEIGDTLKISPNTAASHITNIYRKLDISSVADATKYAIAAGMLSI